MNEKYYCPVEAWDCPCYCKDGSCELEYPVENCDDAAFYAGDREEEEEEE